MSDPSVKKINIASSFTEQPSQVSVKKQMRDQEQNDNESLFDSDSDNEFVKSENLLEESLFEDNNENGDYDEASLSEMDNFLAGGGTKKEKKKTPQSVVSDTDDESAETSSVCTIDLLSADPLFIVLSQFFMSKETGDNIVTVLEKLNKNIEKLIAAK